MHKSIGFDDKIKILNIVFAYILRLILRAFRDMSVTGFPKVKACRVKKQ